MSAEGLCRAVAIVIMGTGVCLAIGSANAETTAAAELEASDSAYSGIREPTPTEPTAPDAKRRREQREQRAEQRRKQKEQRKLTPERREQWWAHAQEVLFIDIQLDAEQSHGVDEIIEARLAERRRSGELQAEITVAERQGDTERSAALREEIVALKAQPDSSHETIEAMRALLSKEQHPTFDMNRAHLVAEGQQPKKKQREGNRLPRVKVKAE